MQGHAVNYKDAVPQSQPLDGRQVANNAGGFSFQARLMSAGWDVTLLMGCQRQRIRQSCKYRPLTLTAVVPTD